MVIGVRTSGWKIEETEFEVLMRGDAGWRLLPVERFLDFPGVGSVYRAPPSYNATTSSAWIQVLVNKRLT